MADHIIIGIDIGGSTTKIVGFDKTAEEVQTRQGGFAALKGKAHSAAGIDSGERRNQPQTA